MWRCPKDLVTMLVKYEASPFVSKIIIINNDETRKIPIEFSKVEIVGNGVNMFVNPAWNLGVSLTTTEKIIIANDDVVIPEFNKLMTFIDSKLIPGMVIGPDISCMPQKGYARKPLQLNTGGALQEFGFGCFMIMYKSAYQIIPDILKVWCGDNILYSCNEHRTFSGIEVKTQMRGTSKYMDLASNRKIEIPYFLEWWKNKFIPYQTIVLVLKSGGDFTIYDVELLVFHLRKQFFNPIEKLKIICLYDQVKETYQLKDYTLMPMPHPEWKGWWSKMNLFSPELEDLRPFLFMDLDTAIVRPLLDLYPALVKGDKFIGVSDFYQPGKLQSCFMYIPKHSNKIKTIWEKWMQSPALHMAKHRGDQDFIRSVVQVDHFWQTISNRLTTFKPRPGIWREILPPEKAIICFHGNPRIREAGKTIAWVKEYLDEYEMTLKPEYVE